MSGVAAGRGACGRRRAPRLRKGTNMLAIDVTVMKLNVPAATKDTRVKPQSMMARATRAPSCLCNPSHSACC